MVDGRSSSVADRSKPCARARYHRHHQIKQENNVSSSNNKPVVIKHDPWLTRALFSFKIFGKISTIIFLFVFDKYCLIMDYLGSKNSSHKLQINYIISYYFYLYLILNICAATFDMSGNMKKVLIFFLPKQGPSRHPLPLEARTNHQPARRRVRRLPYPPSNPALELPRQSQHKFASASSCSCLPAPLSFCFGFCYRIGSALARR